MKEPSQMTIFGMTTPLRHGTISATGQSIRERCKHDSDV